MQTLIIPDVHNRIARVEAIVNHEQAAKTVFLGDWFDSHGDTPPLNVKTANWMADRMLNHPDDEFLYGNHDVPYAFCNRFARCTGFTLDKDVAINTVLGDAGYRSRLWDNFKFHTFVGSYLCTHAGLHPYWIPETTTDFQDWMTTAGKQAKIALMNGRTHWLLAAGHCRGGGSKVGGITWCDFRREFTPVPNLNQIFGHTCMIGNGHKTDNVLPDQVLEIGEMHTDDSKNYDLDTNNLFYALHDSTTDELTIKFAPDEIPGFLQKPS